MNYVNPPTTADCRVTPQTSCRVVVQTWTNALIKGRFFVLLFFLLTEWNRIDQANNLICIYIDCVPQTKILNLFSWKKKKKRKLIYAPLLTFLLRRSEKKKKNQLCEMTWRVAYIYMCIACLRAHDYLNNFTKTLYVFEFAQSLQTIFIFNKYFFSTSEHIYIHH